MREIPKRNYIIFVLMIIGVVLVTLIGVNVYNNNIKPSSVLYKYLKSIKSGELNLYLSENPSTIIYISDKYDLSNEDIEKNLKRIIVDLNLYDNFVYLDKSELNPDFINQFNKVNKTIINIKNLPTLIIFNDNEVESVYYSLTEEIVKKIEFEGVR